MTAFMSDICGYDGGNSNRSLFIYVVAAVATTPLHRSSFRRSFRNRNRSRSSLFLSVGLEGEPQPPNQKPFMVACWPHLFRALSSCRLAVIMASQSQLQPLHYGKCCLINKEYFLAVPKEFAKHFNQATQVYQVYYMLQISGLFNS